MSLGALCARLLAVAELVRQGAVFADIGTDHAHLPIFLFENGKIEKAVCSDINKGPLDSARNNVKEAGFADKCEFILCDGAEALSGKGITDFAICGMGGELIADIIERAPLFKDESLSLILQPMTKQAHLRRYLYKNGFYIKSETYCSEGERHYVIMQVFYSGKSLEISNIEAEIGVETSEYVNKTSQMAYINGKIAAYKKAANGKIKGGNSAEEELFMLDSLKQTLEKISLN